ncbi:hypothetical protein DIPPA_34759 [Diplonema papillatum]|nr:hypothetical protein DIPPA_34759 [Diplonema papillatum]
MAQWQRVPGFLTASLLRSPEGHCGHVYGLVEFVGHEAALRALLSSPADQHVSSWGMSELYVDALTQLELFSEHYPASRPTRTRKASPTYTNPQRKVCPGTWERQKLRAARIGERAFPNKNQKGAVWGCGVAIAAPSVCGTVPLAPTS